jgi:general nucleoside transport system permease protein
MPARWPVVLGTGAVVLPAAADDPLVHLAGALAGALLLLGPAILKLRFGVDEVVTTLLINFIMLLFVQMMLEGPLQDPMSLGWPQSAPIVDEAALPPLFGRMRVCIRPAGAVAAAPRLGDHAPRSGGLRDPRRRRERRPPRASPASR